MTNCETRPTAKSIAVVNLNDPWNIVADPVEDLHAGRNRDQHGAAGEDRVRGGAKPVVNMWCDPDAEAEEGDRGEGVDHDRVAEERLAREDRDDLRDDAEGRQDQNVDLRVTEDPEEVLPEQRVATGGDQVPSTM